VSGTVPERIVWTVRQLRPRRTDTILEIGSGNGAAAELLLPKLTAGKLVALERSATALGATRRRIEPWLRSGRAVLARGSLASFRCDERFDQAFAINVNVFWLKPRAELAALRRVLRPDGALMLVFDPPSASQLSKIAEATKAQLHEAGFERVLARIERLELGSVACIRARAPARAR
jgi:SAM-dependent methyltransferase